MSIFQLLHGEHHNPNPNLTTIPVVVRVVTKSGLLNLKTCSLYHENLLLQKSNDMISFYGMKVA